MSLFDFLRPAKPKTIEDPELGPLTRVLASDPAYWEARVEVSDLGTLKVTLCGSPNEPSPEARAGLSQLLDDLPRVRERARHLLFELHTNATEDSAGEVPRVHGPEQVEQVFTLVGALVRGEGEYELHYVCNYDDHAFAVHVEDGEPAGVAVDG